VVDDRANEHSSDLISLPLSAVQPSPRNPRQRLADIGDLADSIREYGLLQPIIVRRAGDAYELVAGHRRLEAAKSLGWADIPALVRSADEDQAYLLTLIENLQRNDLTAREESRALEVLVRERGWSTRQVAGAVKRSQAYVSKRLRVFEDSILGPLVLNNQMAVSVAEELLPAAPAKRKALAQQALTGHWDGSTARKMVRADARRAGAGARRSAAQSTSLLQQLRKLRAALKDTNSWDLQEAHRREMRLLFLHLSMLARGPQEKRAPVFPPLPQVKSRAG
jgi:ParB family chromosome partitioning protein